MYFQHMVQNQMTPSYPQFTQTGVTGLEEYQAQQTAAAVNVSQATTVTDPSQVQTFKDQQQALQAVHPTITANGVEQQTVGFTSGYSFMKRN